MTPFKIQTYDGHSITIEPAKEAKPHIYITGANPERDDYVEGTLNLDEVQELIQVLSNWVKEVQPKPAYRMLVDGDVVLATDEYKDENGIWQEVGKDDLYVGFKYDPIHVVPLRRL